MKRTFDGTRDSRGPSAAIFDLDGVLVDSASAWFETMNAVARLLSRDAIERTAFDRAFGQDVVADAAEFYGGCDSKLLESMYQTEFLARLDMVCVMEGARECIEALHTRGIRIAIVTNTPRDIASPMIDRCGLAADFLVTCDHLPPKPAPDMLLRACALLLATPGTSLFVGDTSTDARAAKSAGIPFVSFRGDSGVRIDRLEELLPMLAPKLTHSFATTGPRGVE